MSLTLKGQTAELRVGYQVAARLGAWEMDADGPMWTLTATVLARDAYWLERDAFDLSARVGGREWRWRGVTVDAGSNGTMTLHGQGKPEIR